MRRAPFRPSLLILECDPEKLAEGQLAFGEGLSNLVRTAVPSAHVRLVRAASQVSLMQGLADAASCGSAYNVVVVIGHSNHQGLRLTREEFMAWNKFPAWIEPLKPRLILLMACEAGGSAPSSYLFEGIPSVDEIYGSPVCVTREQAKALQCFVPFLVNQRKVSSDASLLIQLGQLAVSGSILFHHTRKEFLKPSGKTVLQAGLEFFLRQKH